MFRPRLSIMTFNFKKNVFMFTECEIGFYNTSCSAKCGHCIDNSTCAMENGYCVKGCEKNYLYPRCKGNVYSQKTISLLVDEIINNSVVITDVLKYLQGFSIYIETISFFTECVDHFYGAKCSLHCGRCKNGEACDKDNGYCRHGCKTNFVGSKCDGKYLKLKEKYVICN